MNELEGITIEINEQGDLITISSDEDGTVAFHRTPEQIALIDKKIHKLCNGIRNNLNEAIIQKLESTQND